MIGKDSTWLSESVLRLGARVAFLWNLNRRLDGLFLDLHFWLLIWCALSYCLLFFLRSNAIALGIGQLIEGSLCLVKLLGRLDEAKFDIVKNFKSFMLKSYAFYDKVSVRGWLFAILEVGGVRYGTIWLGKTCSLLVDLILFECVYLWAAWVAFSITLTFLACNLVHFELWITIRIRRRGAFRSLALAKLNDRLLNFFGRFKGHGTLTV
jgi:hypothetical protein